MQEIFQNYVNIRNEFLFLDISGPMNQLAALTTYDTAQLPYIKFVNTAC